MKGALGALPEIAHATRHGQVMVILAAPDHWQHMVQREPLISRRLLAIGAEIMLTDPCPVIREPVRQAPEDAVLVK